MLAVIAGIAPATVVPDLYEATVAVDHGQPAAFQDAMRQVIVRVTGERDGDNAPALADLISGAQRYVQKYRNLCEILIHGKEHDVKAAQESGESMQDAINLSLDHVKRQAQKNRSTIRDHHRKAGSLNKAAAGLVTEWSVQVLEPGRLRQAGPKRLPRIIKTNNLAILPMTIEDAAESLDGSKNEFIVFRDLDNDRISVMYKRRDNNLGLIAPEV